MYVEYLRVFVICCRYSELINPAVLICFRDAGLNTGRRTKEQDTIRLEALEVVSSLYIMCVYVSYVDFSYYQVYSHAEGKSSQKGFDELQHLVIEKLNHFLLTRCKTTKDALIRKCGTWMNKVCSVYMLSICCVYAMYSVLSDTRFTLFQEWHQAAIKLETLAFLGADMENKRVIPKSTSVYSRGDMIWDENERAFFQSCTLYAAYMLYTHQVTDLFLHFVQLIGFTGMSTRASLSWRRTSALLAWLDLCGFSSF